MAAKKSVVDCGSSLTVATAAEMHHKLEAALKDSSNLHLNAQAVEKVDTAGLQLIVALYKEIDKLGGKVVWQEPSAVLRQASQTLGLTEQVGLDLQ